MRFSTTISRLTLLLVASTAFGCADEGDLFVPNVELRPTRAGCDDCVLTNDTSTNESAALLTIEDQFVGHEIKDVELEVYDSAGVEHVFEITNADLQAGAIQPRTGPVTEYDVPVSLGGVTPTRANIVVNFIDPSTEESIDTTDALTIIIEP